MLFGVGILPENSGDVSVGEYHSTSFLNLLSWQDLQLGPVPQADFPGCQLKRPLLFVFFPVSCLIQFSGDLRAAKTGDKATVEWDGPATAG